MPSVTAIVWSKERHLLLLRQSEGGLWTLPGGIIDPGEFPAQALVREVREEPLGLLDRTQRRDVLQRREHRQGIDPFLHLVVYDRRLDEARAAVDNPVPDRCDVARRGFLETLGDLDLLVGVDKRELQARRASVDDEHVRHRAESYRNWPPGRNAWRARQGWNAAAPSRRKTG